MSEGNMGHCHYCGQGQIVQTVGESTQELRDEIATNKCTCPGALAAKRQQAKEDKKRDYLERFNDGPVKSFMAQCVEAVDCNGLDVEYVQVKMSDGYLHKFYLNKDCDLRIKITKKNEEEISF